MPGLLWRRATPPPPWDVFQVTERDVNEHSHLSQARHPFGRRATLTAVAVTGALMACSFSNAQPTVELILEPTARPTSAPPVEQVQPTEPPTAAATEPGQVAPLASSAFRDDFDSALDPGWSWYQNDSPGWTLSNMPGWLRLNLSTGSFLGATPPSNLLLRPAPAGDFDQETWLRFSPYRNFELAGLVVVFDDHSVLQFGRGFCEVSSAPPGCIGDGLYFDNIQDGSAVGGNFATQSFLGLDYVLRMERHGSSYSASYSNDGAAWTAVGTHTVDRAPVSIGLIAAQAGEAGNFADFDYYQMDSGS